MKKIGFAITSSFCTIDLILKEIENLVIEGYEVFPIVSDKVITTDTRFGRGSDILNSLEKITNKKVVSDIVGAEMFGPKIPLDLMVIAPATGNFIASLAHGITDNAPTMATKATLRNQSPVVIGVSTNDGLGLNGENIMRLLNQKGIYFVPFGQDDPINKPNSLIAHYELLYDTIVSALDNKQFQPVVKEYNLGKINK